MDIPPPRQGGGNHSHYNPDEPRVPAGHPDGGQWTRGGQSGAGLFPNGIPDNVWPPGAQLDGQHGVEFFSDLIPDNTWIPGAQYAQGGNANYLQHQKGVEAAKRDLVKLGYSIIADKAVAVDVPGFENPRVYDLIVQQPETGRLFGVEVKTTLYDTVRLTADQVLKDAAVVAKGGRARVSDAKVRGVIYRTYCWDCERADLRSRALKAVLDAAKIPYDHGKVP